MQSYTAVASFRYKSAQFLKPAWCSNFSKLSVVVSAYRSTVSGLCMMSVPHEKFCQRQQSRFY